MRFYRLLRPLLSALLLACWLLPAQAQQALDGGPTFDTAQQDALYHEMVRVIRCPTCQNQDIAESNAPLAKQLRDLIAEQIKAGKNADDITDYLIERYGDFITYAPRLQKNTLVLWFAPVAAMLLALGLWLLGRRRSAAVHSLSPEQSAQLQAWLAQYDKGQP